MTENNLNEIEQKLTKNELLANLKKQGLDDVLTNAISNANITITQAGTILDLAGGKSITEISEHFHISRTTIYKWLENEGIQKIIKLCREEIFNASFDCLKTLNSKAMKVLIGQLQSGDDQTKLGVAKYIIDRNIKLMELEKVW